VRTLARTSLAIEGLRQRLPLRPKGPINLRSIFVQGFPGAQRFFEQSLIFAAYDCVGGYLLAHMLLPLGVKPPAQSSGQFPVPFGVFPSSLFPLREEVGVIGEIVRAVAIGH
jgi:hypothetical protein